ncbi:MAG: RDD family protein [Actinobacteria bacterium]|jgi:uncharacterized RDD family membrane protein YckC|nr:RDD family protein [Actinomycetota bacterium]
MGPTSLHGQPLAEWWQRFLAILIDYVILLVPEMIIEAAIVGSAISSAFVAGNSSSNNFNFLSTGFDVTAIVAALVIAVIDIGYFALLNGGAKGQTVGQMALGISVRDQATGGPIGPQRAALRIVVLLPNIVLTAIPVIGPILGSIALLWVLIAALSPLWDSRREGFHDKVAKTDVIKVR